MNHGASTVLIAAELFWSDDDQVSGHIDAGQSEFHFRGKLAARSLDRHHYEEVGVAVRRGRSPGVGAKQDDLVGLESSREPTHYLGDFSSAGILFKSRDRHWVSAS